MDRRIWISVAAVSGWIVASAGASLIAHDAFRNDPANPSNPNLAAGEYVTAAGVNQLRRGEVNGGGQNPTIAGFTGAWTGNVTSGSLAVAQWTAEATGIVMPQTAAYHAGGRARFGGASATNTLQRRVQRSLAPYVPSNTYYLSLTSQVLLADTATNTTGFVGMGFSSSGNDAHFASGNAMRGVLIGAVREGSNTDYVVRHVGSSGSLQNDVIEDNIIQSDGVQTVIARLTVVRIDVNDDPANPLGNSKLTIWHQPPADALSSEAAASAAQPPIILRTFGFASNADLAQLTLLGLNWNKAASFDEPRLATAWESVLAIPEPTTLVVAAGLAAMAVIRRR